MRRRRETAGGRVSARAAGADRLPPRGRAEADDGRAAANTTMSPPPAERYHFSMSHQLLGMAQHRHRPLLK